MNKEDIDADNFYSKNKIYYYSPVNYFCQNNICKISHKGAPLYHDRGHLTLSGTRFFGDDLTQFIKVNILNKSLNGNEDNYLMPMKKGLDIKTSNELIVDINSSEFSNDKYKKHEGKALGMYWNGSITSPTYNQNKGEYNLKVNAKGSKAGDVFAKLNIQIYKISNKGKHSLITENTIKSSNEFKHYSTNFELIEPSNIFFKISFINNKKTHSEKGDRNIWLKSITLTRN